MTGNAKADLHRTLGALGAVRLEKPFQRQGLTDAIKAPTGLEIA